MKTLATITALTLATCSPAIASQPICAGMESVFRTLIDLGEEPVMMGFDYNRHIVSVWINEETTTWSYVVTDFERERSCLAGHGSDMEAIQVDKGEKA